VEVEYAINIPTVLRGRGQIGGTLSELLLYEALAVTPAFILVAA